MKTELACTGFLLALCLFACHRNPGSRAALTGGLFRNTDTARLISRQFAFTEGPSVDHSGNVFFTDQPRDQIWEYRTDGKLLLWMTHTLRANGTYFDHSGNLISCADQDDQLVAISPRRQITVLASDFQNRRLNGPNDVWVAPDGDIYFTDPYYQRDYWKRQKPDLPEQDVYLLPKGSHHPRIAARGLQQPNGIVGTPDGHHLFVADIRAGRTFRYEIGADGRLHNRTLFCRQGSDGMTLDARGDVYLCGEGISVYDPSGSLIARIRVPEPWTGNLCFGGKNRDLLVITASKGLYVLPMQVKGVE